MKKCITSILFLLCTYASALNMPTHLQYNEVKFMSAAPEGFYNYDIHVTWHKEPDTRVVGFYSMFQFQFQSGTVGYMGLQQDAEAGKKAIFSIWDSSKQAQTAFPVANSCQRFGHEGSGVMCLIPFAWKAGHEYKLRVWRLKDSYNGSTEKWGGWVIDYTTGEETLIGVVEVKNSNGLKGYGGLTSTSVTVNEFYGYNNDLTCQNIPYFGTTWNGPFADNGSVTPDSVTPIYGTNVGEQCTSKVRSVSNTPFSVTTDNGGEITPINNEFQNLWEKHNLANYKEIDCLYNWAEQALPAVFNQAPFLHRRLSRSLYNLYYRDYKNNGTGFALITDTTANQVMVGKPDGVMEHVGDLDQWKRQAGCKR